MWTKTNTETERAFFYVAQKHLSLIIAASCHVQARSKHKVSHASTVYNKCSVAPGGVAQAMKVTLATSTATMPMEGMPILYACLEVNPAALLLLLVCVICCCCQSYACSYDSMLMCA